MSAICTLTGLYRLQCACDECRGRVPADIRAGITFVDSHGAFEEAIAAGRLSTDRLSSLYAGRFMYMGTRAGRHLFKNSDTREYLP